MLCARCQVREVPVRTTGRPRRYCLTCSPSEWDSATPEERERRRHQAASWRARQRSRPQYIADLVSVLRQYLERREVDLAGDLGQICGCGRDYMQVPLEDAHRCPTPLPPRSTLF